jgi:hypothetical protein
MLAIIIENRQALGKGIFPPDFWIFIGILYHSIRLAKL